MLSSARFRSFVVALVLGAVSGVAAFGQQLGNPVDRVVGPIDESRVVTLAGNVHPMAREEFDLGPVGSEKVLERMVLELEPSAAQQAELNALLEAQQTPGSPNFHKWLTPAEYGARFGARPADVSRVVAWLRGHGFTVNEVTKSNRLVIFSGTAAEVAETFHTEIHRYRVNGVEHIANMDDPQIPAALAGVVGGVLSLHDFRRASEIKMRKELGTRPEYSSGSTNYLFPADWATIYDLNSLYSAGNIGTGASIAIVGRSDINALDVTEFREASGLPANPPNFIYVSTDPGLVEGDQDESTLDVEWSGAIAPAATLNFVVGASTSTTDGVDLSAQYIVNHATAQVVSTSYGSCEQYMGTSELSFYNGLWQQAASQGMSAFVSSGDSGAAGCDGGSSNSGTMNGVNGLCSSPYSTCVGGTEFNEGSNAGQYWSTTNSASYESALSYIPEQVWNESAIDGGSGLWASTGGVSVVYSQPSWQQGVSGTSIANGMRAVPDVAMSAAEHDGYIIVEDGNYYVIAGTSAASPSFAGVMALVVKSQGGTGQGSANPGLYSLLNASTNPFHETLSGNNSVPGVTGFTAGESAYNLATGLGSVDGALLVSSWGTGSVGPTSANFTLSQSATSGTVLIGGKTTFTVGVTESSSANNAVALTINAPPGVTAIISPASITPGTTATVTLTAGSTAMIGTQSVTITGSNSSATQTLTYALTVATPPTLAVSAASSTVVVAQGSTGTVSLTAATGGSFTGNVTWSVSGLPGGVTAAWSANPLTPSTSVSSSSETLTLTAPSTAALASETIIVSAAGDGLTASQKVTLQVVQAPGITLTTSSASVSVQSLSTATVTVTATPQGGVKVPSGAAGSSISLVSGLPNGFTASWGLPVVNASGVVSWVLSLAGSSSAIAGPSTLSLSASIAATSGSYYVATKTLPMTVTLTPPTLSETTASSSLAVLQGASATDLVTLAGNGTYNGAVTLTASGLPAGVTATWSSNPVTLSSESGTSTLTLTPSMTATVGSATITITAKGDGLTATKTVTLQVQQAPGIKLTAAPASISMQSLGTASVTVTATPVGGLTVASGAAGSTISVASGLPKGFTGTWSTPTLTAGGAVTSTLTLTGSPTAVTSTSSLSLNAQVVAATGATVTAAATVPVYVTLTPPTLTMTSASSSLSVMQGTSASDVLTFAGNGTYSGAVALSVSGLPTGVTATWSSNPLTLSSESGTSTLTLTAAATATVTSTTVTVTAKGDGLTLTSAIKLQVQQAPAIKLAVAPGSVSMQSLGTATLTVTGTPLGGFTVASGAAGSTISIASGLPKGFTASWSAPTLTPAGAVVWTLTLNGSSSAGAGNSTLSLSALVSSATSTTVNSTATLLLAVSMSQPTLTVTPASSSLSFLQGQSATNLLTIVGNGVYTGAVSLTVSGLPTGVTATWSGNPITLASETGTSALTLTAAATAKVGSTTITVTASGDRVTSTTKIALQVSQAPALQLALSASTLSMTHTAAGSVTLTLTELGGLNVPTTLTVSGLPAGVTSSLGNVSTSASGNETGTITFTGSTAAKALTTALTIGVNGSNNGTTYTAQQSLTLKLN